MTLNQLKYVVEVAKAGSINKAASNLFVAQSVLSTAIMNLEKEIGHEIFMRSNRGVTLTPFGHTFTSYVSAIQAQLGQIDALIYKDAYKHSFALSVASTGYYFISHIFAEMYEKYRAMGIRVEHYEDHENNVADMVESQVVEIGVVRLWSCYKSSYIKQLQAKHLEYYSIAKLDVAVTVGSKNPLYTRESETISSSDLQQFPSVMYPSIDFGPHADIFQRLKLSSHDSRFITSSRASIYEMLENTDCYYLNSIYPFSKLDAGRNSSYLKLRTFKLENCGISSEVAWIKKEQTSPSALCSEFINRIMNSFSDIN